MRTVYISVIVQLKKYKNMGKNISLYLSYFNEILLKNVLYKSGKVLYYKRISSELSCSI